MRKNLMIFTIITLLSCVFSFGTAIHAEEEIPKPIVVNEEYDQLIKRKLAE